MPCYCSALRSAARARPTTRTECPLPARSGCWEAVNLFPLKFGYQWYSGNALLPHPASLKIAGHLKYKVA
ncbi:hypothetical protein D3C87_198300 [compost metagenome]